MDNHIKISVVIPTRNRPAIVSRAVMSALTQTFKSIEVVVVVDGHDEATVSILKQIEDPRLKTIILAENVGGSDARNAGVKEAKGEWVAFLDDDDEWFPEKLEKQVKAANRLHNPFPVIASSIIARTPTGDFVWPRRLPRPSEPISEYLLARNTLFHGEGLLLTATLLVKKKLLEMTPFRSGLKKYQDWDWVLRVAQLEGVCFEIVPEPLAICCIDEEQRRTVGTKSMWRYSFEWLQQNRDLVTPRAYAGFVATQLASQASRQREWTAFMPLLREMYRCGEPKAIDLFLYLGMWFMPQNLRRKVRAVFRKAMN